MSPSQRVGPPISRKTRTGSKPTGLFKHQVLAKSRRDDSGQIVVARRGGVRGDEMALRVVERLERVCPDRTQLLESMEAIDETATEADRRLARMLADVRYDTYTLARLIAEAQTSPMRVLKRFLEGSVVLNRLEAGIEATRNMPRLVRELGREAFGTTHLCRTCVGTGQMTRRVQDIDKTETCIACEGTGTKVKQSKNKQFAMEKLIEINEMTPKKGPLVQVQQNTVSVEGGNLLERLLKSGENVLYPKKQLPVVDAAPSGPLLPAGDDVLPQDRS